MLAEINPGLDSASPGQLTAIGNALYFAAGDGSHGWEVWRVDPDEQAASMVADIRPGKDGSYPHTFTSFREHVMFVGDDHHGRARLWSLDRRTQQVRAVE